MVSDRERQRTGAIRDLLGELAESSAGPQTSAQEAAARAAMEDFLCCAMAGARSTSAETFADDGLLGRVMLLSRRSSLDDLDDIDWTSGHHPGAVVWPVVLVLAHQLRKPADELVRAAVAGYRSAATIADLLGPEHRKKWHVTATAGAFGAASAASVLLGHSPDVHRASLSFAAAGVGGIGEAPLERRGAAQFNRASAAAHGLMAARAAGAGWTACDQALDGPRGLVPLVAPEANLNPTIRTGVEEATPRLFPANGFAQSAVLGAAKLRQSMRGPLVRMTVLVPESSRAMADGSVGGAWWNLKLAVGRAWAHGDPFSANEPCELDDADGVVSISTERLKEGEAILQATTRDAHVESGVERIPTYYSEPEQTRVLLEEKAVRVLGLERGQASMLAAQLFEGPATSADLDELWR